MQSRSNTDFSHKDSCTDDTQSFTEYGNNGLINSLILSYDDQRQSNYDYNTCLHITLGLYVQISFCVTTSTKQSIFRSDKRR